MDLQLNPKMETMFLLMFSSWGEEEKKEAIQKLENLGIGGDEFYNKNFKVIEKYYSVFKKHLVDSPGAKFLAEMLKMDNFVLSVYTFLFLKHQDWFNGIENIPDEALKKAVDDAFESEFEVPVSDNFIAQLDGTGLTAESKWRLMMLEQQPRKQLSIIASAVKENLPAFEMAREEIAAEIEALLSYLEGILNNPKTNTLLQGAHKLTEGARVIPTIALPTAAGIFDDMAFYGVFVDAFAGLPAEFTKNELLRGAKVIGEKSKLEILLTLKEAESKNTLIYSGELAEKLGITPATVSHHVNALLTAGFITLERNDGKLYPQINPQGLQRFINGVSELLI